MRSGKSLRWLGLFAWTWTAANVKSLLQRLSFTSWPSPAVGQHAGNRISDRRPVPRQRLHGARAQCVHAVRRSGSSSLPASGWIGIGLAGQCSAVDTHPPSLNQTKPEQRNKLQLLTILPRIFPPSHSLTRARPWHRGPRHALTSALRSPSPLSLACWFLSPLACDCCRCAATDAHRERCDARPHIGRVDAAPARFTALRTASPPARPHTANTLHGEG